MKMALQDLALERLWVVYPGTIGYPLGDRVTVLPISGVAPGGGTALFREATQ